MYLRRGYTLNLGFLRIKYQTYLLPHWQVRVFGLFNLEA